DAEYVGGQGGEPRDHHVQVLGTRHPRQGVADRAAQVGDVAAAQVAGRLRGEGRDEERGAAVLAHEARFADGADGDHLAHVAAALDRGRERIELRLEARVCPADGTVRDDLYRVGERGAERLHRA